jgi:hypothetical protein
MCHVWTAPGAREKNLTFSRNDTGAAMYGAMKNPAKLHLHPELCMRDGRIIRTLADAIALLRGRMPSG